MFEDLNSLWYRIRSRFVRDSLDDELAEELCIHREYLENEARAAGATPDEARRAASQRLGNETNIRERTRERWSFGLLDALLQDTRYALRFLRRSPAFTFVAILSLALGIGANATVFTVADRLLFRTPPHVLNANNLHLVNVQRAYKGSDKSDFLAITMIPEYIALREQAKSFTSIAASLPPSRQRLGKGLDAPRINESLVSTNFFDVLGVQPERGRFLLPDDSTWTSSDFPAVISYAFWKRQYNGADSAIGSHYAAAGLNFVVVGVAPPEFTGISMDAADVWVPLDAVASDRIATKWKEWSGYQLRTLVQLGPSTNPIKAAAEATVILQRLPDTPNYHDVTETVELGSLLEARGPAKQADEVKVSTRLVLASAMVLLAACANLANLLLVRALTRRREIALRLAIGVSRARLVSQMLLESLILALGGALAAMLVASLAGNTLRKLVFPDLQWATGTVSVRVFVFSLLCGIVAAVIATIAPAIRMTRADVDAALRSAAPQLTASTGRLRQSLLILQVALSVLLIVGAIAFSSSLRKAYDFDMGVDVDRLLTARLALESDSTSGASKVLMLEEAARRVEKIPGVERASVAAAIPLTGNTNTSVFIPERELPKRTFTMYWSITPELQKTVGFRLLRGRWIGRDDVAEGMPQVALVSETMANKLWPNANPLGRCVHVGKSTTPCTQVIGVVRDLRAHSFREDAGFAMLVGKSTPQIDEFFSGYVVIRTTSDVPPSALVAPVRNILSDLRPNLSYLRVQPLAESLERDYRPLRLGTVAFASLAILAIVLAAIGLYGILAFTVAQRTIEFGIRSALGARSRDIVRLIVGEGMTVVAIGLAAGAALSWYASTAISALLFESTARDTSLYVYAVVVLGAVALMSSIVPARRAMRIDPATALRAE
ncbi:MAG: ADOP family duplicated permease [Gemmatimonadaceae bacterium]